MSNNYQNNKQSNCSQFLRTRISSEQRETPLNLYYLQDKQNYQMYYYNPKFERITVNQLLDISHQNTFNQNWGQDSVFGKEDPFTERILNKISAENQRVRLTNHQTYRSESSSKISEAKKKTVEKSGNIQSKQGHFFSESQEQFQVSNQNPQNKTDLIQQGSKEPIVPEYLIKQNHIEHEEGLVIRIMRPKSFYQNNERSFSQEISEKRQEKCLTSWMTPYNNEEKVRHLLNRRRNYSLSLQKIQKDQIQQKKVRKSLQKSKQLQNQQRNNSISELMKPIVTNQGDRYREIYRGQGNEINKQKFSTPEIKQHSDEKKIESISVRKNSFAKPVGGNQAIISLNFAGKQSQMSGSKQSLYIGAVNNYSFKMIHYKRLRKKKKELDQKIRNSSKYARINLQQKCKTQIVNHNQQQTKQLFSKLV